MNIKPKKHTFYSTTEYYYRQQPPTQGLNGNFDFNLGKSTEYEDFTKYEIDQQVQSEIRKADAVKVQKEAIPLKIKDIEQKINKNTKLNGKNQEILNFFKKNHFADYKHITIKRNKVFNNFSINFTKIAFKKQNILHQRNKLETKMSKKWEYQRKNCASFLVFIIIRKYLYLS